MASVNIKATFQCPIQKVWQTVVSLTNYSWRRDICSGRNFKKRKKICRTHKKRKRHHFSCYRPADMQPL